MSKNSFGKSVAIGMLSIVISVAMLIGVTYAVFNDSSSTSVNTIQAGTLDELKAKYNEIQDKDKALEDAEKARKAEKCP